MEAALAQEVQAGSWYQHYQCVDAAERLAGGTPAPPAGSKGNTSKGKAAAATETSPLVSEIARAREQIKQTLQNSNIAVGAAGGDGDLAQQVAALKQENKELRKVTDDLRAMVQCLESRVGALEKGQGGTPAPAAKQTAPAASAAAEGDEEDDDDVDLFGSDDDADEEAEKLKEQRLKEYNERKAAKNKVVIAKSSIILDIKPWDDETDMKAMEDKVRSIEMDGLLWGVSKLVPIAYGLKKLQMMCVIEDDKVSVDALQEAIEEFEDYVQSTDIAAFNKI